VWERIGDVRAYAVPGALLPPAELSHMGQ